MNLTIPGWDRLRTQERISPMARKKTAAEETVGQRLLRLRKGRGFSQAELGQIVGVSQRMMTYYEREAGHPPAHLLPKLAEALGVTADVLLGLRPVQQTHAPRNTRLWRKLREVEKLPPGDRQAVLKILDGLLARQKLARGAQ